MEIVDRVNTFLQRFPVSPEEYLNNKHLKHYLRLPDWYSKVKPKRFVLRKFFLEAFAMLAILALASFLAYQLFSNLSLRQMVRNPFALLYCCLMLIILGLRSVRRVAEWSLAKEDRDLQHLILYRVFESPFYNFERRFDNIYIGLILIHILLGIILISIFSSSSPIVLTIGLILEPAIPILFIIHGSLVLRREVVVFKYAAQHLQEPLEGEFSGPIRG